ncbi:hypothetical protein TNCV_692941 [Trichonephila clavipes]|nr:hypothetical protein TNCV_692941 [Trichonephila clavipes]
MRNTPVREAFLVRAKNSTFVILHIVFNAEIVELEISGVAIYRPFGPTKLNRNVTSMVLKAKDRRTSCHDEFGGPQSDVVRLID